MIWRILFLSATFTAYVCAADKWVRVETRDTEVLSNAGASTAREALRRFEQIRHVFESRTQRQNISPLPARIFVFRSSEDFRPFQVSDSAVGYYQSGSERDYIAMRVSGAGIDRVVYHEYAHLLMRHTGYRAPVWLEEGTAEMFSTVAFEKSEVRIGDPIEAHILTMRREKPLDMATLLAVDRDSPHYNERGKSGIFYAQSWALVHMLNFSPEYQAGLDNFLGRVLAGEDQARAFHQAFGKTVSNVRADLTGYLPHDRFVGVRLRVPKLQSAGTVASETLDDEEAELNLADLFLAIGKHEQAEAVYARLAVQQPNSPSAQEALGYLALRRNQDEVARRFFERAIELGSGSGRVRYDYATLLREKRESEEAVIALLREAVSLDPRLFDAQHLLDYLTLRPRGNPEKTTNAAKTSQHFASTRQEAKRVEGVLAQVDCMGRLARLHIITGNAKVFILVRDPASVLLKNAGAISTEFTCGAGKTRNVIVEFRGSADQVYGTSGDAVSIEFRDDR